MRETSAIISLLNNACRDGAIAEVPPRRPHIQYCGVRSAGDDGGDGLNDQPTPAEQHVRGISHVASANTHVRNDPSAASESSPSSPYVSPLALSRNTTVI